MMFSSFIFFIYSYFSSKKHDTLVGMNMNSGVILFRAEFRLCHSLAVALRLSLNLSVPQYPMDSDNNSTCLTGLLGLTELNFVRHFEQFLAKSEN